MTAWAEALKENEPNVDAKHPPFATYGKLLKARNKGQKALYNHSKPKRLSRLRHIQLRRSEGKSVVLAILKGDT
jgi:hypothetical protein